MSRLDVLPVELLHKIFVYLSSHEIFDAFSKLSDYLDSVLIGYDRYSLNFHSVLKSQFDITCYRIRPSQVIALKLSDEDETPNQSELFFSHFNIEQFVHLRSFDMSLINDNTCTRLSQLDKLKSLSSLELPRLFQPYDIPFETAIRNLLPQLNRLTTYNTYYLLNDSLPNLRHLTLRHCNCWALPTLLNRISNLHSLDMILLLNNDRNWIYNLPTLTHLSRLIFNTYDQSETVNMREIEQILSKMSNLLYLEVDTQCNMDLLDGQRWESIVSHLIVFDFRFHFQFLSPNISEENILESFRSLFWLEQKHWIVAYGGQHSQSVFTVPRFASSVVKYPYDNWPPLCTSSNFCFEPYIHHLHLSLFNPAINRFTNVISLELDIVSDPPVFSFPKIIECMPLLHSLSCRDMSIFGYLPNDVVFQTIRTLHIRNINEKSAIWRQTQLNRLCTCFPQLERLKMEVISHLDMFLLVDKLKYLSSAQFELHKSSFVNMSPFGSSSMIRNWLIKNSQRLKANNNFTCHFINNKIQLWMSHQTVSNDHSTWYSWLQCSLQ